MNSKGILIRWNKSKGYGFIKSKTIDSDIFIHISELKQMSRTPKIGDIIHFVVTTENNGKKKATNAKIEGVNKKNKYRNIVFNLIILVTIILGSIHSYQSYINDKPLIPEPIKNIFIEDFTGYSCQGKHYCSEMVSCKEARFYLKNCPNVKIDGNNDGEPCESQWCN